MVRDDPVVEAVAGTYRVGLDLIYRRVVIGGVVYLYLNRY